MRKVFYLWLILAAVSLSVDKAEGQQMDSSASPVSWGWMVVRFSEAETLKAIGWSGDRSQLPLLREASKMQSSRDIIRSAAAWAIERISDNQ